MARWGFSTTSLSCKPPTTPVLSAIPETSPGLVNCGLRLQLFSVKVNAL